MKGFGRWLLDQADRDDPVGDLAADYRRDLADGCGSPVRSAGALWKHIVAKHHEGRNNPDVRAAVLAARVEHHEASARSKL